MVRIIYSEPKKVACTLFALPIIRAVFFGGGAGGWGGGGIGNHKNRKGKHMVSFVTESLYNITVCLHTL